jgi:hypothetical protein
MILAQNTQDASAKIVLNIAIGRLINLAAVLRLVPIALLIFYYI